MIKLQRILCPTDFSDCAAQARKYACDLAHKFGAELHVIHVIHHLAHDAPQFGLGLNSPLTLGQSSGKSEKLKAEALAHLADTSAPDCQNGMRVNYAVLWGHPYAEILEYAKSQEIDLIVIGSHGRTGLPRILLGSVAERVVRLSPCPVLTVRVPSAGTDV